MNLFTVHTTFPKVQRRVVQTGGRGEFGVIEWEIGPCPEAESVHLFHADEADVRYMFGNIVSGVVPQVAFFAAQGSRLCSVRATVTAVKFHDAGNPYRVMIRLGAELVQDLLAGQAVPVEPLTPWLSPAVQEVARGIDAARDFAALPVLADALEEAGCARDEVLHHLRRCRDHENGCWVLDAILRPGT
jgi:hypothetical protein